MPEEAMITLICPIMPLKGQSNDGGKDMAKQDYFAVLALQPDVHYCSDRREIVEKNVQNHLHLLDFLVPFHSGISGAPVRLVVFPEFAFHSLPQNADCSWNGVSVSIPGEETELLAKKAKELNIYIASHAWEEYPDLPGRPLSVGFLIDPDGKVILKHHKTVTTKIAEAGDAAPADVYDWFVEKFGDGLDAFFPVADTEIGKMGFMICGEGQYGECSRGLMMNGAEIILRPNAWVEPYMAEPNDMMTVLSRFAAFSNMCYLAESNWAHHHNPYWPVGSGAGQAHIVDYHGRLLAKAGVSCETGVSAALSMESLRRHREEVNFGARQTYMPMPVFRKIYESEVWPKNSLMDQPKSKGALEWEEIRRQVVEQRRDIFPRSRGE
jgi:predicted amidohydrolase